MVDLFLTRISGADGAQQAFVALRPKGERDENVLFANLTNRYQSGFSLRVFDIGANSNRPGKQPFDRAIMRRSARLMLVAETALPEYNAALSAQRGCRKNPVPPVPTPQAA